MNPQQRARLIRSTKKLEAVLGTTPTVELAGRREARLFDNDAKSALSLRLTKARQPLPILLLQSLPSDDKRASITSIAPRSPLSPTYANKTTDFRRKKMAKLARTLGENVPPELVFPGLAEDNVAARRQLRAQRGRSWSVDAPIPPAFNIEGHKSRDNLAPFIHIERTISIDSDSSSATPKSSLDSSESFLMLDSGKGRRKEREWSGEWSHEMDNVIQRLRYLKRK